RRDRERPGIETNFSLTDIQRLMEGIAEEYLVQGRDELSRAKVIRLLARSLGSFRNPRIRDVRPGVVLDHIISRTGVLRELPPHSMIDFWHKSFQEYLAASSLVGKGDDVVLLSHCTEPIWREITIWACSFLPLNRASSLISGILTKAREAEDAEREYLST